MVEIITLTEAEKLAAGEMIYNYVNGQGNLIEEITSVESVTICGYPAYSVTRITTASTSKLYSNDTVFGLTDIKVKKSDAESIRCWHTVNLKIDKIDHLRSFMVMPLPVVTPEMVD